MVLVQVQERVLCAVSSNTEGTCSRLGDYRHVRVCLRHLGALLGDLAIHQSFYLLIYTFAACVWNVSCVVCGSREGACSAVCFL